MFQSTFEFVKNHKGINATNQFVAYQGVGNLVLNIPRRDSVHPFTDGFFTELFDAVFGETGQRLTIIEL